jgi:diketogulonate reductase-like aldo/keto reductase
MIPSNSVTNSFRYGTEGSVGKAVRESGVPREEIFITTKLWNNKHHPEDVASALDASLKDLDIGYVDLYLMHWPTPFARGEEVFPKDSNGQIAAVDIDFVEVRNFVLH